MKKVLFILAMLPLFMVSCSSEDEPGNEGAGSLAEEQKLWLEKNIVGTWDVTEIYNSLSGVWVSTDWGYPDAAITFHENGTAEIVDMHTGNGTHPYSIASDEAYAYVAINGSKKIVISLDTEEMKMTLYDYAKLQKR